VVVWWLVRRVSEMPGAHRPFQPPPRFRTPPARRTAGQPPARPL